MVDEELCGGLDCLIGARGAELLEAIFAQGGPIPVAEQRLRGLQGLGALSLGQGEQGVGTLDGRAGAEELVEQLHKADHQATDHQAHSRANRAANRRPGPHRC